MPDTEILPSSQPAVTILMATYNGAAYLPAQLDSLAAQQGVNWRLVISDDGSTDATAERVARFAARFPAGQVRMQQGPGQGATQNFLSLLDQVADGEWLAFCDQDDVWHPDKLNRAVKALQDQPAAAIYSARTTIADQNLKPLAGSRRFTRPLGLRNALVQAVTAGNTLVANAPAAALLRRAGPAARTADVVSHDWWAYLLASAAGAALVRDEAEVLLYRQHPGNVMGRNDTALALAARLRLLLAGPFGGWLAANLRAVLAVRDMLTPDAVTLLEQVQAAQRRPGMALAAELWRLGVYRQTRAGTAALYLAALAGALRDKG
ncbi:MAG: glycosyltransferase [Paracoccus sp. (in: a-proteobacteria)]|uniref:glycosyltransferase n=1 Tax=Paracoccus sp. TaxID=267 RepID=UPI0026DEC06C|nr:glycosyltransferase [Paracoccus sp. (in: a-proteobacteria)]MDO5621238.1 glycosyltransferase [Paracoccus sp. (in: a-proteobacteria)]